MYSTVWVHILVLHPPSLCQINLKTESISVTNAFQCAALHRMSQHLPVKLNGGRANLCEIKARQ